MASWAVKVKMQTWNSKVKSWVENNVILEPGRLEQAERFLIDTDDKLDTLLINSGWLDEEKIPNLYASLLGCKVWQGIPEYSDDALAALESINVEFLLNNDFIPLNASQKCIEVGFSNPHCPHVIDYLRLLNAEVVFYVLSSKEIELLKEHCKTFIFKHEVTPVNAENLNALKELALGAPTVNLVNSLINKGVRLGASDLHIEPVDGRYRARYRIDGILKEAEPIPNSLQLAVVSRIKILSGMDIAEKRRPQDGKIAMKAGATDLDIRCSTLPLGEGESIVMRFLIKSAVRFNLSNLGYSEDLIEKINADIKKTSGVILMTGPTGSGKTTSLYSFLSQINSPDVKIVTLEDPIEYQLPGVNQVQVNAEIGYDFSTGLRSIVRQDPDVIMVGEIRDNETAKIALQSALTGHLVFSTVHTNDAPSAYTRLLDLGIQEYLLNAGLVSIMAQRLARKLCEHCKEPLSAQESEFLVSKYGLDKLAEKSISLFKPSACSHCEQTGYQGRVAFLEYLPCDSDVKRMAKDEKLLDNLYELMKQKHLRTLKEDGFLKAIQGITTIDEVLRVAG